MVQLTPHTLLQATPDWEDKRHPHYGAEWYEQAWKTSRFNYDEKVCGQLCVERILEVVPCSKGSLMFQAGAHLGVFPFIGMALGCSGLSVEGNPVHIPFMQLNARLNGFQDHFTVVNAIVGEKDDTQGLSFAGQSIAEHGTPGAVTVPMVKLDTVFKAFSEDMHVSLGIIDTEGYENNVLQGAVQLVKSRRVAVWVIEVWYRQRGRNVSALPGLRLLLDNGYKLFDVNLNQIGASSADINKMLSTYCAKAGWRSGADGCLMDHVAIKEELAHKVVAALRG